MIGFALDHGLSPCDNVFVFIALFLVLGQNRKRLQALFNGQCEFLDNENIYE